MKWSQDKHVSVHHVTISVIKREVWCSLVSGVKCLCEPEQQQFLLGLKPNVEML